MALETLDVTPEMPDTEATSDVGAPVKSGAPTKGGISPVGTTLLNPKQTAELLANMERMIAEKTGPYAQLMGGVQDALAYAAPQAGNQRALALQYRNEQKRQEMQDVFGMRQQMAALQASAGQAQAQREAMDKILGGGGGAQPQGGGNQPVDIFGSSEIPPEVRQQIAMDPVNGPDILKKYLQTAATERTKARLNPAWFEMTEVVGTNGQIEKVPRIQAVELAMQNPNNPVNRAVIKTSSELPQAPAAGGVNQFNVGNVRPAGKSTGFQQPKSYDEGLQIMDKNLQSYGQKGINTLRGVISRWAPPNENDTNALVKNAAQRLGISPDQPIDLSNPAQRQAVGMAIMLQEKGPKQLFAAVPTSTKTDVGGGGGGAEPLRALPDESVESFKTRKEEWQKEQDVRRKGLGTQVEATEKFLEGLKSGAEAAKSKSGMVKQIERHATDNPKDFFIQGQTEGKEGVLGAISNYRRFTGGEEKGKEAEQAASPYLLSPEAVKRRKDTDTFAGQLAMGSSKELIGDSSVRLGAQIEKMFLDLKGLGTQSPAETNIKAAKMYSIMLDRTQRQNDVAREYVAKHPTATPNEIVNSPEYRQIDDWASNKLESVFGSAAKVTPQEMARMELQRRKEKQ